MSEYIPQPGGNTWQTWANSLNRYLGQIRSKLRQKTVDESASEDGVILWDRQNKYPVVSKDGEYVQIILEDGNAEFEINTDVTAASPNTAYPISSWTTVVTNGISIGTPSSRIVFEDSGEFLVSFSAQIESSSAATVNFWFWALINGSDPDGRTIKASLHNNGATIVVSRSTILAINAGDYLEAMWATDNISGYITAAAATAFAPATPATTLSIARIHG